MADAFVSALVSTILGNFNSLALERLQIDGGLKTDLRILEITLTNIQAVLEDAERKQRKSQAINNWLTKLKDVAYDVDDLLDEVAAYTLTICKVSGFFSSQNPFVFNMEMARKVREVSDRLDAISKERLNFHLSSAERVNEVDDQEWGQTSSLVDGFEIFGRHEEGETIIDVLLTAEETLSIFAICGVGGLGKTTLAQLVYNDPRVKSAFELTIWVCVSDDFDVKRLIKAIIKSIGTYTYFGDIEELDLDALHQHLQKRLGGKKFLLVLDDVWNESQEEWEKLRNALRCGGKGSVVLVTTQIERVGLIMATLPIHHLSYLSHDSSWLLFKKRAFGMKREEEYNRLEGVGKEIVKKCGGVPLAVKALGSLLHFKHRESDWLSIKESEVWDLGGDGSMILPALRLSYDNLPSYLRECFAFCAIFPKGSVLDKSYLIKLWIANGLVHPQGEKELSEVGDDIFTELSWRSFFQDVKEEVHGGTGESWITCRMHDLVHDLASSIMRYECFVVDDNHKSAEFPERIRHLQLCRSGDITKCHSLRTLIVGWLCDPCTSFHKCKQLRVLHLRQFRSERLLESICNLIHLRYLNLSESSITMLPESIGNLIYLMHLDCSKSQNIKMLPESIGNLKHLSHLNMSYCPITELPESIGNLIRLKHLNLSGCSWIKKLPESSSCLQNLQVLNLMYCHFLEELPRSIRRMRSLKCLDIRGCGSLKQMPPAVGKLRHLQELGMFIAGKDVGCKIDELKELRLGKELIIKELNNVKSLREARNADLVRKQHLQSLHLIWKEDKENIPENVEEVLSGFQPHPNLKRLEIYEYQGLQFPDWMNDMPNLVSLKLHNCRRCSLFPPLWKLPLLRSLEIYHMEAVKCIVDSELINSFPSLQTLRLQSMPNLERWTTMNAIESLNHLILSNCPKLVELPNIPSLKHLDLWGRKYLRGTDNLCVIRSLTQLTSLSMHYLPGVTAFPDGLLGNHTFLKRLTIHALPYLKCLSNQLQNLSRLTNLELIGCNNLEDIPEAIQDLGALQSLKLEWCGSLVSFPVNGLNGLVSLCQLEIRECWRFAGLSNGVRYLTSLERLSLEACQSLKLLPGDIQHLNALQELTIKGCEELICLPIQIEYMTSLDTLRIEGSPHLKRRCDEGEGEDWPKIAHIPNIYIS